MENSHHLLLFFFLTLLLLLNHSTSISNPDIHPLLAFKSSSSPTTASLSSWSPASNPCSGKWLGVACRGGRVTRVLLPSLALRGQIQPLTLLPYLRLLNLSHNHLSGSIPASILLLGRLRRLDLSGNLLSGSIPAEVGLLPRLLTLRLEGNLLTGVIPVSLGSIHGLSDFNISRNYLVGEIPISLSSFPSSSFSGNKNLCGKPLLSSHCSSDQTAKTKMKTAPHNNRRNKKKKKRFKLVAATIAGSLAAVTLVAVAVVVSYLCFQKKRSTEKTIAAGREQSKKGGENKGVVFFEGCKQFTVDDLMRGSAEMLGRGTVGTTYRVVMEGEVGRGVVVKRVRRVLKGEAAAAAAAGNVVVEGLLNEIGELRHPNVVSLRAYYLGDDEMLLVYDYHPDGSLYALLHGNRGPGRTPLDWATRLKLAWASAQGLAYLHTSCKKSNLSHQNLTSSNILLDDDSTTARISEFGLHHLLSPPSKRTTAALDGQKSDVYSFGVILLELLTGRMAGEAKMELSKWVQRVVVEEWTSEVFDLELVGEREVEEEMVALLQVALLCVSALPGERPRMGVAAKMIEEIMERGSSRRETIRTVHNISCDVSSATDTTTPTPSVSEVTPTFASS